jgi:hypothetical protein
MPQKERRKRKRNRKGMCLADRPVLEARAAGAYIGARQVYVAVPPNRAQHPVRVFATFTEDLNRIDWLQEGGIRTVAMESTGVYWIPLVELLDNRGLKPCLVNAANEKRPGTAHRLARLTNPFRLSNPPYRVGLRQQTR